MRCVPQSSGVFRDLAFGAIEEEDENTSLDSYDPRASPISPVSVPGSATATSSGLLSNDPSYQQLT